MEQGRESSADQGLAQRLAQLEAIVSQQQAVIAAYQEQLERQNAQLALMKRALFASRRERYLPSPDQRLLFSSPELSSGDEDAAAGARDEEPPPARPARARGKKFVFPAGLPSRRIEYKLLPAESACSCCHEPRVVINEQVTRQLELEPARAYVVEHVRFTYACPNCRTGDQMQTSAKPPLPIEKSPFGPSVLATIAVYKYARHIVAVSRAGAVVGPAAKVALAAVAVPAGPQNGRGAAALGSAAAGVDLERLRDSSRRNDGRLSRWPQRPGAVGLFLGLCRRS
jgi:transposase